MCEYTVSSKSLLERYIDDDFLTHEAINSKGRSYPSYKEIFWIKNILQVNMIQKCIHLSQ